MRTRLSSLGWIVLVVVATLPGPGLLGQVDDFADATSAKQIAKQAHDQAKSAKSLEELTEALRLCGQSMKSSPDEDTKSYINKLASWTYNKRGELLVKLAEETSSLDAKRASEYEQAAIKDFGLAVRFDAANWKPHFNRGVSIAILGDYPQAIEDLNFVIQQQPRHKNAIFNRAEIQLQLGNFEQAVADYTQVIQLDPQDAAAYSGRGISLSAMGNTEKALLDLDAVVRLNPEGAEGYVDRADLYASLGNWERAAGDYRVAVGIDSQLGRAYRNVAWMMATCPDGRFRDPTLAVRAARKAIKLDGETHLALDTLAAALASSGSFDEAKQVQQRAITVAPPEATEGLQARLGMYERGRPFLENRDSQVRMASAEEPVER